MSSKSHEEFSAFFQELNNTYIFRTAATCHKLISFILEGYCWFSRSFRESSCDESDNSMFDVGGIVEKNSFVLVDHFECMFDEMFSRCFSLTIQIFEFRENRIEFIFSSKQKGKSFIRTIHSTCSINSWSHMESDNIRIHILVFPFDKFAEST